MSTFNYDTYLKMNSCCNALVELMLIHILYLLTQDEKASLNKLSTYPPQQDATTKH
jgi:hypothetical protein